MPFAICTANAAATPALTVSMAGDTAAVVTTVLTSASFSFASAATAAPLVERLQSAGGTAAASSVASAATLLGRVVDLLNLPRGGALGIDDSRHAIAAAAASLRVLAASGNGTSGTTMASVQRVVAETVGVFSARTPSAPRSARKYLPR